MKTQIVCSNNQRSLAGIAMVGLPLVAAALLAGDKTATVTREYEFAAAPATKPAVTGC